jgi:hypothetical protein
VAEDVALDKSCTDALSYVRTYEQLRGYHKQLQPNMVRAPHQPALQLASSSSSMRPYSSQATFRLMSSLLLIGMYCLCLTWPSFPYFLCGGCTDSAPFHPLNSSPAA